jgi:hypothetical protein
MTTDESFCHHSRYLCHFCHSSLAQQIDIKMLNAVQILFSG